MSAGSVSFFAGQVPSMRLRPPGPPAVFIPRVALMAAITASVEVNRVTFLHGMAGCGRTTALAEWYRLSQAADRAVGWLSLDDNDTTAARLAALVLAAVESSLPVADQHLLDGIAVPTDGDLGGIAPLLARFEELSQPITLVLDDVQALQGRRSLSALDELIRYAPSTLRLVASSRTSRHLPVAALRARDELGEITQNQIAFSPGETAQMVAVILPDASAEVSAWVYERVRGHPLGTVLTAAALRDQGAHPGWDIPDRWSHSNQVLTFVLDQVIPSLSAEDRLFLLRSSIVGLVCAPLAQELTGRTDAAEVLRWMAEEDQLFDVVQADRTWYRHHPWLREALRRELRDRLSRDELAELHRAASTWYFSEGNFLQAGHHALVAGDRAGGLSLLSRTLVRLYSGDLPQTVVFLADSLPPEVLETNVYANLVVAAGVLGGYPWSDVPGVYLDRARRLSASLAPDERVVVDSILALLDLPAALHQGDVLSGSALVETAMRPMPGQLAHAGVSRAVLDAAVLPFAALFDSWRGYWRQALASLDKAERAARVEELPFLEVTCRAHRTMILYANGLPSYSFAQAWSMVRLIEWRGWSRAYAMLHVHLGHAWNCFFASRVDEARDALDNATWNGTRRLGAIDVFEVDLMRSELAIIEGDLDGAEVLIDHAAAAIAATRGIGAPFRERLVGRYLMVALARGDLDEAERLVRGARTRASTSVWLVPTVARVHALRGDLSGGLEVLREWRSSQVEELHPERESALLLAEGHIHHLLGDIANATRLLGEALWVAAGSEVRRPFLDHSDWVAPLLHRRYREVPGLQSLVESLIVALRDRASVVFPRDPYATLTETEREVLALLIGQVAASDIARMRRVSLNTVKTQVKSIYRKLGVSSRAEAVDIAVAHGLTPPP